MPELSSFDDRFFSAIWKELPHFGFDPFQIKQDGMIRRQKLAFSPTFRDGVLIRLMPGKSSECLNWVGMEFNLF